MHSVTGAGLESSADNRWWLHGDLPRFLAEDVISLLKDMSDGSLGGQWPEVTKGAVAENILALTKLEGSQRESSECLGLPVVWMALASLCVLDQAAHVDGLTSKAAVQTTR